VLAVCLTASGAPAGSDNVLTNRLSIHFVVNEIPYESIQNGTATPFGLDLLAEPILSDADFISFNTNDHTFAITAEAAKRMALKWCGFHSHTVAATGEIMYELSGPDTPFVLLACGEPIYLGVLTCVFSSDSSGLSVPIIKSSQILLRANSTAEVIFRIKYGWGNYESEPELRGIRLGYPYAKILRDLDPRRDRRISLAVKSLFSKESLKSDR